MMEETNFHREFERNYQLSILRYYSKIAEKKRQIKHHNSSQLSVRLNLDHQNEYDTSYVQRSFTALLLWLVMGIGAS